MQPEINSESKLESRNEITSETVEDKALAGIRLPPAAPKTESVVTTSTPTTNSGKLSPAMAALAAARAASGKNQSAVRPAVAAPVAVAPVEIKVEAPVEQPKPAIQTSRPVEPLNSPSNFVEGDIPPPWDDAEFASVAMQSGPPIKQKEINDGDYFVESIPVVGSQNDPSTQTAEAVIVAAPTLLAESTPKLDTPKLPSKPLQLMPVAEINWDGHWPNLAASLPVRGVTQQLAQQSELRQCFVNGNAVIFRLCVPVQTLLSAGSVEKLCAAINERFVDSGLEIRIETEIGAVEQTANAQALAERAERQDFAERAIQEDGFVLSLMREFGATILTGSVRPV